MAPGKQSSAKPSLLSGKKAFPQITEGIEKV